MQYMLPWYIIVLPPLWGCLWRCTYREKWRGGHEHSHVTFFVPLVLATPLTSYIELARNSRGMVNLFRTTMPSSYCPPHSSRFFTTRNHSPNWHTINYFLLVSTYLGKHMRNRSNVSPKSTEWTFICLFLQRKMMVEGENVHTIFKIDCTYCFLKL